MDGDIRRHVYEFMSTILSSVAVIHVYVNLYVNLLLLKGKLEAIYLLQSLNLRHA